MSFEGLLDTGPGGEIDERLVSPRVPHALIPDLAQVVATAQQAIEMRGCNRLLRLRPSRWDCQPPLREFTQETTNRPLPCGVRLETVAEEPAEEERLNPDGQLPDFDPDLDFEWACDILEEDIGPALGFDVSVSEVLTGGYSSLETRESRLESLDPVSARRVVCNSVLDDDHGAIFTVNQFETAAFAAEWFGRLVLNDETVTGVGDQASMSPDPPVIEGVSTFTIQVGTLFINLLTAGVDFVDRDAVRLVMVTVAEHCVEQRG